MLLWKENDYIVGVSHQETIFTFFSRDRKLKENVFTVDSRYIAAEVVKVENSLKLVI